MFKNFLGAMIVRFCILNRPRRILIEDVGDGILYEKYFKVEYELSVEILIFCSLILFSEASVFS